MARPPNLSIIQPKPMIATITVSPTITLRRYGDIEFKPCMLVNHKFQVTNKAQWYYRAMVFSSDNPNIHGRTNMHTCVPLTLPVICWLLLLLLQGWAGKERVSAFFCPNVIAGYR